MTLDQDQLNACRLELEDAIESGSTALEDWVEIYGSVLIEMVKEMPEHSDLAKMLESIRKNI